MSFPKTTLFILLIVFLHTTLLFSQNCTINVSGNESYSTQGCSATPSNLSISGISKGETFTFDQDVTVSSGATLSFQGNSSSIIIPAGITVTIIGDLNLNGSSAPKSFSIDGTLIVTGNFNSQNNITYQGSGTISVSGNWQNNGPNTTCGGSCNLTLIVTNNCSNATSPICQAVTTSLPIELLSFTATAQDNAITFAWRTALEVDNDFFTLEVSEDGLNFSVLTTVAGSGTTSEITSYNKQVPFIGQGIYYFRLKQTDFDGSFAYSEVISIRIATSEDIKIALDPQQPDALYISGIAEEAWSLSVMDLMGRVIYEEKFASTASDSFNEPVRVPQIATKKSVYLFKIITSSRAKVIKL